MPSRLSDNLPIDPALTSIVTIQHDQYKNNGKDLLLRSLHNLELPQGQLISKDAEAAERMAQKVHVFSKAIQEEFEPTQAIHEFLLPQVQEVHSNNVGPKETRMGEH